MLTDRQTDKQTRAKHVPPPLSEVTRITELHRALKKIGTKVFVSFVRFDAAHKSDCVTDRIVVA